MIDYSAVWIACSFVIKLFHPNNYFQNYRQAYAAGHTGHTSASKMQFGGVLAPMHDLVNSSLVTFQELSDVDTCLKLNNYEHTVRLLDMYYGLGNVS